MKARPYMSQRCEAVGQRKTNTREFCLPSFLVLQGEADWRNMLAVVSKSASWIWTVAKPQSDRKQAAWLLPMFELGSVLIYLLPRVCNRMSNGLTVH